MTTQSRETSLGLLQVVAAGIIWGSIPVFLRMSDASSVFKVFGRVSFAALAMLVYMASRRRLRELTDLPRDKLVGILIQGILLAVNWVLFLTALDMTDVAVAELLAYTGPVLVAALAPFVSREPFDARVVFPLVLALAGTAVILGPQQLALGGPKLVGALLAFGSAFTYAMLMLRSKRLLHGVSVSALMLGEYLIATVLLLPAAFLTKPPSMMGGWAALAVLGVVQTAFAVILFLNGLRHVRTDHAAILTYAEPVSAVLFAALLLSEPLGWATLLGGAAVVTGGMMVARMAPSAPVEAPTGISEENA